MFLEKFNLGNETTAKQFVEEANKNVTSVLDERFGLQYDVAFKQKVLMFLLSMKLTR